MRRLIRITAVAARFVFLTLLALAIIVGGLVYLAAADLHDNQYFSLLVTIFITVGSILVSATSATIVHKWFTDVGASGEQPGEVRYGDIFYRYVIRFAWIITPLAGGYGLLTISEILR